MQIRRTILKYVVPEFVWPKDVDIDGVKFCIRGTPYSFGIKYFLSKSPDAYERPERYFLQYIKQGDHVIELGSSIGIISRLIREKIGEEGRLIVVEASQKLTSFSKTWLEEFSNITVLTKFAFPSHRRTPIRFRFDDSRGSLGGTILFDDSYDLIHKEESFFIEDAENDFDFYPRVLVCDIEGSEIILLEEDASVPDYIELIIIELHPSIYLLDNTVKIIERIKSFGFLLHSSIHSVYFFQRVQQ